MLYRSRRPSSQRCIIVFLTLRFRLNASPTGDCFGQRRKRLCRTKSKPSKRNIKSEVATRIMPCPVKQFVTVYLTLARIPARSDFRFRFVEFFFVSRVICPRTRGPSPREFLTSSYLHGSMSSVTGPLDRGTPSPASSAYYSQDERTLNLKQCAPVCVYRSWICGKYAFFVVQQHVEALSNHGDLPLRITWASSLLSLLSTRRCMLPLRPRFQPCVTIQRS